MKRKWGRRILLALAACLAGTMFLGCVPKEPTTEESPKAEQTEQSLVTAKAERSHADIDLLRSWAGTWAGILLDDVGRKAIMIEIREDGEANLLYCEDQKDPVDGPGATGSADFRFVGENSFQSDLWRYQSYGEGESYPDTMKMVFSQEDYSENPAYDTKTGLMMMDRVIKGQLYGGASGDLFAELLVLPLSHDITTPPAWVWEAGVDEYKDGMTMVWSPWAQNVLGSIDNIIVYTTEDGERHIRSAYGEIEYISDLNGDGVREIMMRSFLTEMSDGISNDAPVWVTIYNLSRSNGMLLDRSANNTVYYKNILIPSYEQEIAILEQYDQGYDEETLNVLIGGRKALIEIAQALCEQKLLLGDRKSVVNYIGSAFPELMGSRE